MCPVWFTAFVCGVAGLAVAHDADAQSIVADGHVFSSTAPPDVGTNWITQYLEIGYSLPGTLTIGGGATATITDRTVLGVDGDGALVVTGTGSEVRTGYLTTGVFGFGLSNSGTLEVRDDARVESGEAHLGQFGVEGRAIVSGPGSEWRIDRGLFIGEDTNGTMTIADGGVVSDDSGFVARYQTDPDVPSAVTVTGRRSLWDNRIGVAIGGYGAGFATLTDGGILRVADGSGTVELAQFTGATGTLNIGAPLGEAAAIPGVLDAGTIAFGAGTGVLTFNHTGVINQFGVGLIGEGMINHAAGGTVLTGDSSAFGGVTVVTGGTLRVNGRLGDGTSFMDVGENGTLGGSGTIDSLRVRGRLAPGNSIGTLRVAGDAAFDATSVYEVEIAGDGMSDRLEVNGDAELDGAVEVITLDPQVSYVDGQSYRILDAETVSGTFTGARTRSAFLTTSLSFDSTGVDLHIGVAEEPEPTPGPNPAPSPDPTPIPAPTPGPNPAPSPDPTPNPEPTPEPILTPFPDLFTRAADSFNQKQAAGALGGFRQDGDSLAVFNRILALGSAEAKYAFDQLSGEIHATGQEITSRSFDLFTHALSRRTRPDVTSRSRIIRDGPNGSPKEAGGLDVWIAPLTARGTLDPDSNASAFDWSSAGLVGGVEHRADVAEGDALLGIAFGYQESQGHIDAIRSRSDTETLQLGAYGAWDNGPISLSGAVGYAIGNVSTARRIAFRGVDRMAKAEYGSHTLGFAAEAAYDVAVGADTIISPLMTLHASWSDHDGARESGADALDLNIAEARWNRMHYGMGLAVTRSLQMGKGQLSTTARVVFERAFGDEAPRRSLAFAGGPTEFTVMGPDPDRDRVRIGLGLRYETSRNLAIQVGYEGLVSRDQHSHRGFVGLNIRF